MACVTLSSDGKLPKTGLELLVAVHYIIYAMHKAVGRKPKQVRHFIRPLRYAIYISRHRFKIAAQVLEMSNAMLGKIKNAEGVSLASRP